VTRPAWFDEVLLLRGLAVISVVALHVFVQAREWAGDETTLAVYLFVTAFTHGVMTFIAVSGFVLANKYGQHTDWLAFYAKRAKIIIPPYLIFTAVYLLRLRWGTVYPINLKEVLKGAVMGNSASHMWFFVSIIQLYLLFPVIYRVYLWFEKNRREAWLLGGTFVLFLVWTLYSRNFFFTDGGHRLLGKAAVLIPQRFFLNSLFYFLLGIYARRNFESVKIAARVVSPWALAVLILILGLATAYLDFTRLWGYPVAERRLIQPPAPLTLFRVAMNLSLILAQFKLACYLAARRSAVSRLIGRFGRLSYGIYLIHVLVLVTIQHGLVKVWMSYDQLLFYPVLAVLTFVGCYVSVLLLSKIPFSEWFIGVKKQAVE